MYKEIFSEIKLLFIPCLANDYRPKFLDGNLLFYCLIALLILKFFTFPFLVYYFSETSLFADITRAVLINLTNKERMSLGLQPLKENVKLDQAAYLKAKDMLKKDYFSHKSPKGVSPWYWFGRAGYRYKYAGENLAIGFLDSEEVYRAWLNSFLHKKNLLNPNYKEIGIAVVKGDFKGVETSVVVQHFGTPQDKISPLGKQSFSGGDSGSAQSKSGVNVGGIKNLKEKKGKELKTAGLKSGNSRRNFQEPIAGLSYQPEEENNFNFNVVRFLYSNYYNLLQIIIFGLLTLTTMALLINIFVEFNVQRKDLILKAVLILILMSFTAFLGKGAMVQFIPHDFFIY